MPGTKVPGTLAYFYNDFESKSAYEQGRTIGNVFGQVDASIAVGAAAGKLFDGLQASNPKGVPGDIDKTLQRIQTGDRLQYKNDGSIFQNREGLLPSASHGYYREYVHPTAGVNGPGAQRVVQGVQGETFYTPDHYKSFIKLPKRK